MVYSEYKLRLVSETIFQPFGSPQGIALTKSVDFTQNEKKMLKRHQFSQVKNVVVFQFK